VVVAAREDESPIPGRFTGDMAHLSPVKADKKKKQKVKPWYAATSLIHVDSSSFS
jgi:hypothetical protein